MQPGLKGAIDGLQETAFEVGFACAVRVLRPDLIGTEKAESLRARALEAYREGKDLSPEDQFRLLDRALNE